ncbi:MAG: hypothetical protein H0V51_25510 [Chloroflexi bacterium]|nr:hypothetical protein [Chloroflexota bacterium]
MGLWERFWSAVLGDADSPPGFPAVTSEQPWHGRAEPAPARLDAVVEVRAQRAAERLVEDERLRRNLTDEQFGPLLGWALALVDRVAEATAGESDEAAEGRLDRVVVQLRETLSEVDRLAGALGVADAAQVDRLIAGVIRTKDLDASRRIVMDCADDPPKDTAVDGDRV